MNSSLNNLHHINRLSLFSNNQDEYDFYNAEKIHRSNSLKRTKESPSNQKIQNELELDSVSEKEFRVNRRFPNLRLKKKGRTNSININPADLKDEILSFEGVLFYLTQSNGLTGSLTVNSKRIVFTSGFVDSKTNHKLNKHNFLKQKPPNNPLKEDEDSSFYEIDLMNIAEICRENSNERSIIHIHCRNFKYAKIGLRQMAAESLYQRLITDHERNFVLQKQRRSFLWEYLHDQYHYLNRGDWVKYEKWYVNNFKIQFSQFNEIVGLCPTMPEIVIVPRKVDDKELESIVNISDGQRVPIITYLYRPTGHMIIRSTSFNSNRLSLHDLYKEKIFDDKRIPMKEFDISLLLPSLEDVEKNYLKLRKACSKVVKMHQNNTIQVHYDIDSLKSFWSKCSPWLCTLAKVLRFTTQLVDTINRKASIGLIEKNDCNWNCLLSSLVQISLDPDKRTIKGFEPLLSKEWLYLSGYKCLERSFASEKTMKSLKDPNSILFILFLDAVHQLILQNQSSFEFSTFYLILLLDNQFNSDLITRDKTIEFENNKTHPLMINPFYEPTQKVLKMKSHVAQITFFTKLYFRSLGPNINRFTNEELLFLTELESRNII